MEAAETLGLIEPRTYQPHGRDNEPCVFQLNRYQVDVVLDEVLEAEHGVSITISQLPSSIL